MHSVTMLDELSSHQQDRTALPARLGAGVNKLIEAWLLWISVGATTGALVLAPSLMTAEVPQASPSAVEIEHAVAQAEAQGIAAGAEIRNRAAH